jgi:hypothetical protein
MLLVHIFFQRHQIYLVQMVISLRVFLIFRAPGYPEELVDNEEEEKGYEI